MKSFLTVLLMILLAGFVRSQDEAVEEVAVELPVTSVDVSFREASWFEGEPASATVLLPEMVEEPEDLPQGGSGISVIALEILENENGKGAVAVIQWVPLKGGLVVFPAMEFSSETTLYQSAAKQVSISVPKVSNEMELSVTPGKTTLFAGEPLRLDIQWTCRVPTKRLRSLRCNPEFFNDAAIEVVVPRSVVPEDQQMGMPFGGRRVIAERVAPKEGEGLGVVSFQAFLRIGEPGKYTLPAVHLEVARLMRDGGAFAPYAAYFNNGLFDSIADGEAYERVFVESDPIEVEVLPLPEKGRLESFSGLFAPTTIEVSAKPTETEVGQLVEIDLLVRSQAPHGFLELPALNKQRALRSWFKVDSEYGRAWHAEGTVFRTRLRPLTTKVKAIPSLEFEIFDPTKGEYQLVETDEIPLQVLPRDGRDYFDSKALGEGAASLTDSPNGIWQNAEINTMDEILNKLGNFLANYFWLLLAAGPVLFALLLPWVKERRRCAQSLEYRARHQAYRAFKKLPVGSAEKWKAFREFIAISLGVEPAAWTTGDAQQRLQELGVAEEDIEVVVKSQESQDAETFSHAGKGATIPELNDLAKRIGRALSKSSMVILAMLMTGTLLGESEDWIRATKAFDQALEADAGSGESVTLFTESALNFEACARDGENQGKAWLNAGNAWFQAGEIGRAIASYRQSEVYRPFDQSVRDNLAAARALAVDVVESRKSAWWLRMPFRWIAAVMVPVSLGFWICCLGYVRFRKRPWMVVAVVLLIGVVGLGSLGVLAKRSSGSEGVVIVPEVFARKGPSYRYQTAFNEAFHDGLELKIIESRDGWLQVELADERRAWVPEAEVQRVVR